MRTQVFFLYSWIDLENPYIINLYFDQQQKRIVLNALNLILFDDQLKNGILKFCLIIKNLINKFNSI